MGGGIFRLHDGRLHKQGQGWRAVVWVYGCIRGGLGGVFGLGRRAVVWGLVLSNHPNIALVIVPRLLLPKIPPFWRVLSVFAYFNKQINYKCCLVSFFVPKNRAPKRQKTFA